MNKLKFKLINKTILKGSIFFAVTILLVIFAFSSASICRAATSNTVTLDPMAIATVSNFASGDSSGNTTGLTVGVQSGVAWQSYIIFDTSAIPQDATIKSANLTMKSDTFIPGGNRWVNVYSSSPSWSESTLTWDNKPDNGLFQDTKWIDLYNNRYSWECTNAVKAANGKVSLAVELLSGTDGYVTLYSPQLEVTYSVSPPAPQIDPTVSIIATILASALLVGVLYAAYRLVKSRSKPTALQQS